MCHWLSVMLDLTKLFFSRTVFASIASEISLHAAPLLSLLFQITKQECRTLKMKWMRGLRYSKLSFLHDPFCCFFNQIYSMLRLSPTNLNFWVDSFPQELLYWFLYNCFIRSWQKLYGTKASQELERILQNIEMIKRKSSRHVHSFSSDKLIITL